MIHAQSNLTKINKYGNVLLVYGSQKAHKYRHDLNQAVRHHITVTRPSIHLLHRINQYCVMMKRDLFPMNEMDLKFSKPSFFIIDTKF